MKHMRFSKLYLLGLRYPKLILSLAFALSILSFYLASQLKVKTDFSQLLPKDTPSVQNLEEFKKSFGSLGFLYITIEDTNLQKAEAFADSFVSDIEALPSVRYVDYKKPVDYFKDRLWLFLDLTDVQEMENRVDRSLELAKKGVSPIFSGLMDFADEENRPDLTFEDLLKKYQGKYDIKDSPFETGQNDEEFIILRVKSYKGSEDFEENRKLLTQIKNLEKQKKSQENYTSVQVGYAGHYMTSLETVDLIKKELTWVSLAVALALALILFAYFKRLSASVLVGIPLTLGIAWTSALIEVFLGHVNILTAFGFSILAGLGSDYGIYLMSRFFRERDEGVEFKQACDRTFLKTGKGVKMAAFTTMAAFAALFFSRFDVFFELGLVGFFGLFFNYLAMVIVLPALLSIGKHYEHIKIIYGLFGCGKKYRFFKKSQPKNILIKVFKPKAPIGILTIFIFLCLLGLGTTYKTSQIVYDEKQTEFENLPSAQTHDKIMEALGSSLHPTAIMVKDFKAEAQLVEGVEALIEKQNQEEKVFKKVVGLSNFIPKQQEEKKTLLRRIVPKYNKNPYVNEGQKRDFSQSVEDTLQSSLITQENLPLEIKRSFLSLNGAHDYVVYMFANISRGTKEGLRRFNNSVYATLKALGVEGRPVETSFVFSDILDILEKEAVRGFGIILLFLLGFLLISLRNIKRSLLIYFNLIASLLVLSGVMYIIGIHLTILNIVVFPILFGTGVDCFIHFSHHFDETGSLDETLTAEVPPILTTNMTSIIGFSGLLFTSGIGLQSIGWIAVLGLIIISLVCVFIFPRWLSFGFFRK